jgi:radical SAM superfamily enzyme YgiQ (UPF0313 family)
MARVLLTNTPWLPFHTLQALFPNVPPLGLQVLAGALRAAGHEAHVVDVQRLPPGHPRFAQALAEVQPDVVGFSNNEVANAPTVLRAAREVSRLHPAARLVAGGQIPTFRPTMFLKPEGPFDAVVQNEADRSIAPLVDALSAGREPTDVPGVAWRRPDGSLGQNPLDAVPCDLDATPLPHWEGSLCKATFTEGLSASVETSRGCPYRCSFCSIPGFYGPRPRYKSAARILDELRHLKALGVTELYFIDDSFATDPRQTRAVFEGMLRERLDMRFLVQIRADVVVAHPDLIALGARAGMYIAVVGFEGYTSSVQADAAKGNSGDLNRRASRVLRQNGVAVYGTHVFGSPEASLRDNLMTFFLGRTNADIFRMTIFTPLPGSRAFAELAERGELTTQDFEDYYYGKYVIRDSRDSRWVQAGYFGLLALHYALPDTLWKALGHRDPVIRAFHRRSYDGALRFVLGKAGLAVAPREVP